jgi:hypothetical protein
MDIALILSKRHRESEIYGMQALIHIILTNKLSSLQSNYKRFLEKQFFKLKYIYSNKYIRV